MDASRMSSEYFLAGGLLVVGPLIPVTLRGGGANPVWSAVVEREF